MFFNLSLLLFKYSWYILIKKTFRNNFSSDFKNCAALDFWQPPDLSYSFLSVEIKWKEWICLSLEKSSSKIHSDCRYFFGRQRACGLMVRTLRVENSKIQVCLLTVGILMVFSFNLIRTTLIWTALVLPSQIKYLRNIGQFSGHQGP